MSEELTTLMFLAFGSLLAVFGAVCIMRRHVPMSAFAGQRKAKPILHLLDGPAVLAGLAMGVSGLLIAGPLILALVNGDTAQRESMLLAPAISILAIGGFAAFLWQVARNVTRVVTSDEVQNQMAENLQKAVREANETRDRDAQAGITPD